MECRGLVWQDTRFTAYAQLVSAADGALPAVLEPESDSGRVNWRRGQPRAIACWDAVVLIVRSGAPTPAVSASEQWIAWKAPMQSAAAGQAVSGKNSKHTES
jgi:hypothetical protein